ncbi:PREDICTED: uncharacterized protein LOC109159562 [Ipomoea nil]|uniref:uncharacterized protein LOC109159562 n=1 Tax=Ipomoea nil TaxID=35883 RepID=UPI000900B732|nr:PREDICTED: uncharacterized protein LOC109159562 [Ipomoea nil]
MDGAKSVSTPMSSSMPLVVHDGKPVVDATGFRRLVGLLPYLSVTRPDIAYVVNSISQHMHLSKEHHWVVIKRLLRYLKGTIFHSLLLRGCSGLSLTAFSDSDWGGNRDDDRSTTGFVIYLGPNVISWKSVRQKTVSRSSTEAVYRALASSTAETIWVRIEKSII